MESNETSPTKESDGMLEAFLSNTRSVKGKTTELQFLTTNSDIICLTETHLDDDTIPSGSILPIENRTVFRRDRNIYGGGVMIAVCDQLNPKQRSMLFSAAKLFNTYMTLGARILTV